MNPPAPPLRLEACEPVAFLAGFYHFRRPAFFRYRIAHAHHLLFVESGAIRFTGHDGGKQTAGAADLICFRPTPRNEYRTDAGVRFFQVSLRFAPAPRDEETPLVAGGPLPERIPTGEHAETVKERFQELCRHIEQPDPFSLLRTRAALLLLLADLAQILVASPGGNVSEDDLWHRARTWMDMAARREVRVAALAQHLGISREHLIRGFRTRFGLTPHAYHQQARLAEAARELRHARLPVKALAADLGYGDWRSFSRAFRQHWGVSPARYRADPNAVPNAGVGLPLNTHLVAAACARLAPTFESAIESESIAPGDRPSWRPQPHVG